ncbi:hypothetical protein [Roseateles sp. L2-2]|uniref:hypothetical protein n=1 Tax=Roseateles sp. L2-2 TaxID=3422597 RepID=UPI003D35A74B
MKKILKLVMPLGPMFSRTLTASVIVAVAHSANAAPDTCKMSEPPPTAGEEAHMGELLLVYPRAKDAGDRFSGCQSIWGRTKTGSQLIGRFEYSRGAFVAVHDGAKRTRCTYSNDELRAGSDPVCPGSLPSLIPTLPPGCFAKFQRRAAGANESSPECDTFE